MKGYTEGDVPWLIEDERGDAHSCRVIGLVAVAPPHDVVRLRAIRDDNGQRIEIPAAHRAEAEEDVRATAIDLWRAR